MPARTRDGYSLRKTLSWTVNIDRDVTAENGTRAGCLVAKWGGNVTGADHPLLDARLQYKPCRKDQCQQKDGVASLAYGGFAQPPKCNGLW